MADLTDDKIDKLIDSINALNRNVSKGVTATDKNTKSHEKSNKTSGGSNKSGDAKVVQDLINENKKLAGIVGTMQSKFKALDKGVASSIDSFKTIASSTKDASTALGALGTALGVGGVLGTVVSSLKTSVKTYQELSQVGQTFGGSMLQMQMAAANAAMPLEQFAKAVRDNAVVVASIGADAFGSMSKALRESLTDFGQLGLTSEQLTNNLGNYLDTQRLYGNLSNQTTAKATANMKELSIETAKAAQMTGVNTDAINKMASTALRDETLRARLLQMNSDSQNNYGMAMNKAIIYMSALPGEAGKTLSTMLAQTAGRGSAIMTDASQTFIEAGLFGVTSLMDNMAQKVANNTWNDQDAADFNRKFVAEGMKNMATLQFQAATGNKAAAQAIVMISEMKELANKSPEELARTKQTTKFLENLGLIIDKITGTLKDGFFKGLDNLMKGFDKFGDSPEFKGFIDKIQQMAERFGMFLSENITPEKLIKFGEGLAAVVEGTFKLGSTILGIIDTATTAFGWLTDKIGLFGAALVAFVAWQTTKAAGRGLAAFGGNVKERLAEKFNIGKREEKSLTEGGVQSAFEHALMKFAQGNALRTYDTRGGQGGSDFDFDRDKKKKRTRRTRRGQGRTARLGQAMGEARPHLNVEAPHHTNGNVRPNIEPHNLPQPNTPHVPHVNEGAKISRLDRMADAMSNFRQNAHTKIVNVIRSPKASVTAGAKATGRGLSRVASGAGRVASRAGGAIARGGAGLLKGGMTLARGIGPGALVGGLVAGGLALAPDFKGKETIQTMAEFAAMGSILGPIGTAVGAGVGAIYANWDDLSGMMSGTFQSIKNFDYAGVFATAGGMLSSIGGAFMTGGKAVWNTFGKVGDLLGEGFTAIKDFDYAGAFNQAAEALGPIGAGVKMYVSNVWGAWKKVGGWMKKGWSSIKNSVSDVWKNLMGSNNSALDSMNKAVQPPKTDLATPITEKFNNYTKDVTNSFTDLNQASQTALQNVSAPTDLMPNQNVDLFKSNMPAPSSITGPTSPAQLTVPEINTDSLVAQQSEWKTQSLALQKDNLDTKNQLASLLNILGGASAQQVGGLRDLINEQQKGNRSLDTLSGNII